MNCILFCHSAVCRANLLISVSRCCDFSKKNKVVSTTIEVSFVSLNRRSKIGVDRNKSVWMISSNCTYTSWGIRLTTCPGQSKYISRTLYDIIEKHHSNLECRCHDLSIHDDCLLRIKEDYFSVWRVLDSDILTLDFSKDKKLAFRQRLGKRRSREVILSANDGQ